jgi:two-component system, OmpR family, sensor histidine kinase KdpD
VNPAASDPVLGPVPESPDLRRLSRAGWSGLGAVAVTAAVVAATAGAAALEAFVGVQDASAVYLLAVVLAASLLGVWAAVATSVASFLVYDYLFTSPRFTFAVSDPAEWLSLLLFLVVAVAIGRLTSALRDRADEADRRARESVALVAMSRDVALAATFEEAAPAIVARLLLDAEMTGVAVQGATDGDGLVAIAGADPRAHPGAAAPWRLVRGADGTTDWLRVHPDGEPVAVQAADDGDERYVVDIAVDGERAGMILALRSAGSPRPGRGARRLLVLAADQLGIAVRRDRLREDLTAAEVARRGDALRAAILDSVSHDLRTPVASIRALAGGLADAAGDPDPATVRRTAAAIDSQGERLGMLLNGLLDMGRIQAGALRPDLAPYDLAELVETTLRSRPPGARGGAVEVDLPEDLPPVVADAVLFDVVLGNVLDNAAAHAPDARIRVSARALPDGRLAVDVDDGGPGVPADAIGHLFDRFYRAGGASRSGSTGLGLAVARGFVEVMGGTIAAEPSPLGGLGIRVCLPAAAEGLPA